jgi:hypothetical protein
VLDVDVEVVALFSFSALVVKKLPTNVNLLSFLQAVQSLGQREHLETSLLEVLLCPFPPLSGHQREWAERHLTLGAATACHSVLKHQEEGRLRGYHLEGRNTLHECKVQRVKMQEDLHLIPGCPGSHNVPIQETINSRVMKRWDFCPPVVCLVFRRVWKGRSEVAGIEQHEAISSQ